jgi:electron transport complex protein RnfB
MVAVTFTAACTGCGACLLTCPTHAIRPAGGHLFCLAELCTGCAECVEVCPADAITMPGTTFADLVSVALTKPATVNKPAAIKEDTR